MVMLGEIVMPKVNNVFNSNDTFAKSEGFFMENRTNLKYQMYLLVLKRKDTCGIRKTCIESQVAQNGFKMWIWEIHWPKQIFNQVQRT